MSPNQRIEILKQAAELLRQVKPLESSIEINVNNNIVTVSAWNPGTYEQATEWLRSFGVGIRHKEPNSDGSFTSIRGEAQGIWFAAYPEGLPPTCRKEKYVERIPKQQTVETGEFIEVERERVVCSEKETV